MVKGGSPADTRLLFQRASTSANTMGVSLPESMKTVHGLEPWAAAAEPSPTTPMKAYGLPPTGPAWACPPSARNADTVAGATATASGDEDKKG